MARLWRNRWLVQWEKTIPVVERLQDAQRPGGPMTFSLEQILQLFGLPVRNRRTTGVPSAIGRQEN